MPPWAWIPLTLFAVVMQTARTAGQKHLSGELDPITVTLVRFLFGLPFAAAYLAAVMIGFDLCVPRLGATFVTFTVVAGLSQVAATVALIHLFSLRNFAVGTTYARTEAFLTALLGATVFGELIGWGGWSAICASVAGVVVLTRARSSIEAGPLLARLCNRAATVGLLCGLLFALTALSIRRASLSLEHENVLFAAGLVLVAMVALQTIVTLTYVATRSPEQLPRMWRRRGVALFVGATSALGSMGWFVAFTLERASYVKALGQVEFILVLAVSALFFRERTNAAELLGMLLIAVGILLLVTLG